MKKVALIKGDGVGPELVSSLLKVLDVVKPDIEFIECEAGAEWWEKNKTNSLIPNETWNILDDSDACFKGPTTTPGGEGTPKSVAVSIRQKYDLYANVRPIETTAGVELCCVREATEGFYFGGEMQITDDVFISIRRITRDACRKIARYAFEEARRRDYKNVVAIHKSNILKKTCGTFLEETRKVQKDYPDIELSEYHIDDMAQQIIKNVQRFDKSILLSTNLFMDIISEECSGLAGSIGLIPSANIGDNYAMFEPAHGSAPKYKGLDKVNPTATILAGAWMLEYLGDKDNAEKIRLATKDTITEKRRVTYDLGGDAKMSEMTDEIIKNLKKYMEE